MEEKITRPNTQQDAKEVKRQLKESPKPPTSRIRSSGSSQADAQEMAFKDNILKIEREARQAESDKELIYQMVNSTRALIKFRQAMYFKRVGKKRFKIVSVSSLSAIETNSLFIRWLDNIIKMWVKDKGFEKADAFNIGRYFSKEELEINAYPFPEFVIAPLKLRDDSVFGLLIFTKEDPWTNANLGPATRIIETFCHAYEALIGPAKIKRKTKSKAFIGWGIAAIIALAAFIPVPLTALAPGEVVAQEPVVVSAPIDGVIDEIEVAPNSFVKNGDLLFKYTATDLRNRVALAAKEVEVSSARLQQFQRSAFSDANSNRELVIAKSELDLKSAEYEYALDLLSKAEVKANSDGLIIFSDKDDWTGRPVSTGERIMRIADPEMVRLKIDLPVSDAIVLEEGARIKFFLDSDPLKPLEATLVSASYHATSDKAQGDVLSYKVNAKFEEQDLSPEHKRIGLRGTAQIFGEKVTLAFFVFRKPLAKIRQWTGY